MLTKVSLAIPNEAKRIREVTFYTLNSHFLFMTLRHNAFIKIIRFVRVFIFVCLPTLSSQTNHGNDVDAMLLRRNKRDPGHRVYKLEFTSIPGESSHGPGPIAS